MIEAVVKIDEASEAWVPLLLLSVKSVLSEAFEVVAASVAMEEANEVEACETSVADEDSEVVASDGTLGDEVESEISVTESVTESVDGDVAAEMSVTESVDSDMLPVAPVFPPGIVEPPVPGSNVGITHPQSGGRVWYCK